MLLSYFQRTWPASRIERNVITGRQKKIDCCSIDGLCTHCNTFWTYGMLLSQLSLSRSWTVFNWCQKRGKKKRQQDEVRRDYTQQKGYQTVQTRKWEWWRLYKTDASVGSQLREKFLYKLPLSEECLMLGISDGRLFGYFHLTMKLNICVAIFQTFLRY